MSEFDEIIKKLYFAESNRSNRVQCVHIDKSFNVHNIMSRFEQV